MSSYEIIFVVRDCSAQVEDDLLEFDVTVLSIGRLQLAYVNVSADSSLEAVEAGFKVLADHGVYVERLHLDLVSKADIASRLEISKTAVGKWVEKCGVLGFPKEYSFNSLGPVWEWSRVNEWLRRSGKPGFDDFCTLDHLQVSDGDRRIQELRPALAGSSGDFANKWVSRPVSRVSGEDAARRILETSR